MVDLLSELNSDVDSNYLNEVCVCVRSWVRRLLLSSDAFGWTAPPRAKQVLRLTTLADSPVSRRTLAS